GGGPVAFDQIQPIIQSRCAPCHSAKPTQEGIAAPPKGVILEAPSQIQAMAAAINQQAAVSRVMPPGNMTHMTDAERRLIARWFAGGAQ
ncbi:MAG TPA: cysteine desulfurase, partial [Reyranella sp.]|nr:cysteine desulfurase [Reyranella sp.]